MSMSRSSCSSEFHSKYRTIGTKNWVFMSHNRVIKDYLQSISLGSHLCNIGFLMHAMLFVAYIQHHLISVQLASYSLPKDVHSIIRINYKSLADIMMPLLVAKETFSRFPICHLANFIKLF